MSERHLRISRFTFSDLFAGLGGFHKAAASFGGKCVFASEIDEELRDIYRLNFQFQPDGDIRSVKPTDIPVHDLLCAGFPCQPWSKAGKQAGLKDGKNRGTLIDDLLAIIKSKRPRLVLLENVAHFVNHNDGDTYRALEARLKSFGYDVDKRQYSPHEFGIPQIRERVYMIAAAGSLEGFEWPVPPGTVPDLCSVLDDQPNDAVPLSKQVIDCLEVWQRFLDSFHSHIKLPSFPIWAMEFGATYPTDRGRLDRIPISELRGYRGCFGELLNGDTLKEIRTELPSHALRTKDPFPRWKQTFIRQNREFFTEHESRIRPWMESLKPFPSSLQKLEWNCQNEERKIWNYVLQFRASGVRVKRPSTAPSLVAMTTTQVPIIGWEKRYMTARECARLQSLGELKHLPKGIRAFKAMGNAVNVTVIRAILQNLLAFSFPGNDPKKVPIRAAFKGRTAVAA